MRRFSADEPASLFFPGVQLVRLAAGRKAGGFFIAIQKETGGSDGCKSGRPEDAIWSGGQSFHK
jgi:hypothetical protein